MREKYYTIIKLLHLFFICMLILTISSITVSAATISELRSKFPNGAYWNHMGSSINNPDGYTWTPCDHSSHDYYGKCGCNSFNNSIQYMGFAAKLYYDYYGVKPSNKVYNLNDVKAGDIIRFQNDEHSIFILSVNSDTYTVADCLGNSGCIIRWNATIKKSTVSSTFNYRWSAPYELSGTGDIPDNNDSIPPTISNVSVTDVTKEGYTVNCTITDNSRIGRVEMPTWTLNQTNGNEQDDLQKYVYSENLGVNFANVSVRISISNHNNEMGTYRTHIYAYDQAGNQSSIAVPDVLIENEPPVINNVHVSNITSDGYTVYCTVADNNKIGRVEFPTWTTKEVNGSDQDDLTWNTYSANLDLKSSIVYYRIKKSDHNNENGVYRTHIYAYDQCGNQTAIAVPDVNVPLYFDYIPTSVFEYNNNIYAVYDDAMTFTQANALCKSAGGHLVTIDDLQENAEITKHLKYGYYFIGYSNTSNSWTYDNSSYRNWNIEGNEPNNYNGIENCTVMLSGSGVWNDAPEAPYNYGVLEPVGFVMEIEKSSIMIKSTKNYGNNRYEFYNVNMPYSIAKYYAESKGGHLITISSVEENAFVASELVDWTWLALTDKNRTVNDFVWTTGETLTFDNWNTGEPNDDYGEDNAGIHPTGKWNDTRNQQGYYLAIEYDNYYGDINSDGKIDDIDATLLLKHISDISKLDDEQLAHADVNNDNKIDLLDAVSIQ